MKNKIKKCRSLIFPLQVRLIQIMRTCQLENLYNKKENMRSNISKNKIQRLHKKYIQNIKSQKEVQNILLNSTYTYLGSPKYFPKGKYISIFNKGSPLQLFKLRRNTLVPFKEVLRKQKREARINLP